MRPAKCLAIDGNPIIERNCVWSRFRVGWLPIQGLYPLLKALLEGLRLQYREQPSDGVMGRNAKRQGKMLLQPLCIRQRPNTKGLGTIRSGNYSADRYDNQVPKQVPPINRAPRVFKRAEVFQNGCDFRFHDFAHCFGLL